MRIFVVGILLMAWCTKPDESVFPQRHRAWRRRPWIGGAWRGSKVRFDTVRYNMVLDPLGRTGRLEDA